MTVDMLRFLVLVLSLLLSQLSLANAENLGTLLNQRLSFMKSVAIYKWHQDLPIEDLDREQVVLNLAARAGLKYGIIPETSRVFFQTQIDAAKEIQNFWFVQWKDNPETVPENAADLVRSIRPRLIDLSEEITVALANAKTIDHHQIQIEGLSKETIDRLVDSIQKIRKYTSQLDQVMGSGILRVGTTGDYTPFSTKTKNGYRGIDIDMAKDLADSLEVDLVWVETSWPTLMKDFNEGKFDIAMSGISIILKRQRQAFFSEAYHKGGKSPIARCEDVNKFGTLSDIDQSDIQVIVNPGGTNEKYANENLVNAQIILHKDNRSIFLEIINGHADVMITDAIEVQAQSNKHPELCATMPKNQLTYSEKGYLLPRDIIWKNYVDTWLNQRMNDHFIESVFNLHLD